MSLIKPSRSLNNKGVLLGLEFSDFMALLIILMSLRVLIPVDGLLIVHLGVVFVLGVVLSIIRLKFRSGFIYSYTLGIALNVLEKVEAYVKG